MGQENGRSSSCAKDVEINPCTRCGACCAFFRVEFYWREAGEKIQEGEVPLPLTEDLDSFKRCMKGTNQKRSNQCAALKGRVGDLAYCSIYANRPSPCQKFSASYVDGKPNKRCDEAREAHGLPPLRREDWPIPSPQSIPPPQEKDLEIQFEYSSSENVLER